ncbi:diguanylate cyclase [Novosphingobium sp. PC22D]|nr:diguanylate cyclase [Novosphingobium sp. PC22D]
MIAVAATGASARAAPTASVTRTCHTEVAAGTDYATAAALPGLWTCGAGDWSIARPRAFVRFDLSGATRGEPLELSTRLTRFDHMKLIAIGTDGAVAMRDFGPNDLNFATTGWKMRAALPDPGSPLTRVVMRVDGARHVGLLSDARIGPESASATVARSELLLAWLCGLLSVPLIFNFAFYRVLRQSFVLWHASAVLFMLVHTVTASGLINRFVTFSMMQISVLSAFSWGLGIACAAIFLIGLIEPGKLSRRNIWSLRAIVPWVLVWTTFYLFADGALRGLATPLYNASFFPVIVAFVWAMATAARRGSRAVRFQILAWTPLLLACVVRLVTSVELFGLAPQGMMVAQHVAIGLEIVITSLGVADRFLIIKRQRDNAIAHTKILAGLAERDPLTGLYNRRAIEARFSELIADGFRTMAVIDLDQFKAVNDTYGHTVGDSVLQTVAVALMPESDTIAVRMGGEEFLLLLRGRNAADRAERRRQAIPSRVASEMPGLEQLVTASMGLVEYAADTAADFAEIYRRCDELLYNAKDDGRNRTRKARIGKPTPRSAAA